MPLTQTTDHAPAPFGDRRPPQWLGPGPMGKSRRCSTRAVREPVLRKLVAPSQRSGEHRTSASSGRRCGRPPAPAGSVLSRRAAALRVERQLVGQARVAQRQGVHSTGALKQGVRDAARLVAAFAGAPPPSEEAGGATLVVVVLLHETLWPNWEVWGEWEALHAGTVAVYCHLKAGVALPDTPEGRAIRVRLLLARKLSLWGELSLTGVACMHVAGSAAAGASLATHRAAGPLGQSWGGTGHIWLAAAAKCVPPTSSFSPPFVLLPQRQC